MSTSLLYHAFGIRGYTYLRTEYHHGQVFFTIRQDRDALRCSACGAREVAGRGHVERRFKSLPIGGKPVSIVLPIPRVECAVCKALRQVEIGFIEEACGSFTQEVLGEHRGATGHGLEGHAQDVRTFGFRVNPEHILRAE